MEEGRMSGNDPMRDGIWTQTPGTGTDFEKMYFDEVEDDDLFWLSNKNVDGNKAHRKINENTALIISQQRKVNIESRRVVYQKI